MNSIILDIFSKASYSTCYDCGSCHTGYYVSYEGEQRFNYECEECYRIFTVSVNDCIINFADMRRYILHLSKGKKFINIKAILDYYMIDYEMEGYTIPVIYADLKKEKNMHQYILFKLLDLDNIMIIKLYKRLKEKLL